MHLSINFCGYAFFDKIFLSLSTSWWNLKKSEDKLKQQFNKVCTKLVLKWNKTYEISVHPAKCFFSKDTSNKLIVFSKYFHIKKGKWPVRLFQSQLKISCSYVLYLHVQEDIAHALVYQTKQKYHLHIFLKNIILHKVF